MRIVAGSILLLVLSWNCAFAKEDMKLRALMESKETDIVTMVIGGAGLTLQWVNTDLAAEGKQRLYCPPRDLTISKTQYVAIVKKYLELHPDIGEETFQLYPLVLLKSLKQMYPC